ncbi:hypothetical protein FQN52_000855 [Onygenales sp. PD_12]|nr:hypothetical protein FQN52_000855 [Onygenales sp. PD_12]
MKLASLIWSAFGPSSTNSLNERALSPRNTPSHISPLPPDHRRGLIAVGVTSLISTLATAGLFAFITYRLVHWRKYYSTYIGYNQYVILIYNLLLADLQQAVGFLLALYWVDKDMLTSNSPACFVQGWLLQVGDPSSGLFVLAIAVHTFATVLMGRKLAHRSFVGCGHLYVPSGAWCWIDERFEYDRLWTHYLWIFLSEFGSVVLYTLLFFHLRRRVAQSAALGRGQKEHLRRLRRVIGYMVLYPIAYIVLSLPLAAGRMATARGDTLSISYFCTAGAVIASSGFVDVIMYTLTRKALIIDSEASNPDRPYLSNRIGQSHITTVTAETKLGRMDGSMLHRRTHTDDDSRLDREGSTDNIMHSVELGNIGKVYQQTTIEITSEPAEDHDASPNSSINDTRPSAPTHLWER